MRLLFTRVLPPTASCGRTEVNMADVSERTLQVAIVVSFAAGFIAGWQANRMRRRFLDWRKKRLQDKLAETPQKNTPNKTQTAMVIKV
ncbi:mitoregulin-like [Cyprinus carpio]|uniref:Mitoregulin-like n=1 Tax=Cyprinus carpio TaxID=7962 RepID=A0A9Q9XC17_CYPCA|nr:mitoregulin-like [Cyprinus carpio]